MSEIRSCRPRLTLSDWRLLAAASILQLLVWLALRTHSVGELRRRTARLRPLARRCLRGAEPRILWAIEASGRRLPLSTCLVRAIVAELALGCEERPLRVHIGVKRTTGETLQSHAWLADGPRILVGGAIADQFLPMVVWESDFR